METIDGTILVPEPHCTAFAVDIIVQPVTQHQELQQTLYIYILYMHSESTRGSCSKKIVKVSCVGTIFARSNTLLLHNGYGTSCIIAITVPVKCNCLKFNEHIEVLYNDVLK